MLQSMEFLMSRMILRPRDPARTAAFYRDKLGLAVFREFPGGTVFFLGNSLLEVSGHGGNTPGDGVAIWLQVRDIETTARELTEAGVPVDREPKREPWGLTEMWLSDPDGLKIVVVEVPDDHPMRRDQRPAP